MILLLLLFSIQLKESYKTNLFRRNCQIEVKKSLSSKNVKNIEDLWYFVHFNQKPNYTLLSEKGISIKTTDMISNLWYSLFLTPSQANYLTKFALLKPVDKKEKIINPDLIKFSEFLQIETSSTFDSSIDLQSFNKNNLFIYKFNDKLYQIGSNDNYNIAQILSNNNKVYAITPQNGTIYFNNRAAGFTQYNTPKANLSGQFNNIISIDRPLEAKGLNGEGQVVLIGDTYLDTNSAFFYDPKHPNFVTNKYYDDHRKIKVVFDEFDYKNPKVNEHGTHAAGCSVGSSYLSSTESDSSLYNGIAPKAKIAFYQSGTRGIYNPDNVKNIVSKTHACVCANSWGSRSSIITSDNQWNEHAKNMKDTLTLFAAGNNGKSDNYLIDNYETITSPGGGKNILTVGALSSIPIDEKDSSGETFINYSVKSIYFYNEISELVYNATIKPWSINNGIGVQNPGIDYLFTEGSVEIIMTTNITENFTKNHRILIIKGKDDFEKINKQNPPLIVVTTVDFDINNFEYLGFSYLFPIIYLDSATAISLYNSAYSHAVMIMTNYVISNFSSPHRATFSSKGPSKLGVMKPDIVAPGTSYFSAQSVPGATPGHPEVTVADGTSAAASNAAGAAALVAQYFVDKKYRAIRSISPSSSLLRSILINSADPLDPRNLSPNAEVGFGALNLGKYLLVNHTKSGEDDENVLVADRVPISGDQHLVGWFEVKDGSREVRVTMSYLDEALSDDSSAALVVDLDLIVVAPDGEVFRGNMRADGSEEMFSTNERVIIRRSAVKPGVYRVHVMSHIPAIVPGTASEFSVSVFGSLKIPLDSAFMTFAPATECVPVVGARGTCNRQTTRNECIFDDMEAHVGHSCQSDVAILVDSWKALFEVEPYGVKYVNIYYPYDAVYDNLTISVTSATRFPPKYAYNVNPGAVKGPLRELDAENILADSDISLTLLREEEAGQRVLRSALFSMVYNRSPKKTTFVVGYQINLAGDDGDEKPVEPSGRPEGGAGRSGKGPFFVPFIVAIVAAVLMFVIVILLAIMLKKKPREVKQANLDKSLKSPLL